MKQKVLAGLLVAVLAVGSAWAGQAAGDKVPTGDMALGAVRIPRAVMVDGTKLGPGTYQLRVTGETAKPAAPGASQELERYVEFLQSGQVKARAVASIVPASDIKQIAETSIPGPGRSRVEMLKGGDYWRIWVNRGGTHYLIHLPPA